MKLNEHCRTCGRMFGLAPEDQAWFKLSGETYICPNCGQEWLYVGGNIKKVRKKYDQLVCKVDDQKETISRLEKRCRILESRLYVVTADRDHQVRRIRSLKGVITRIKTTLKATNEILNSYLLNRKAQS